MSASPLSPSCLGSSRTNRNVTFVMKSKKITFGKNCIYIICCIQIRVLGKQEIAYKYAKLVISWPPPSTWFPSTWWWQPEKGRCLWCKISWAYKRKIVLKCPNNQFQSLAFMKLKVEKKKNLPQHFPYPKLWPTLPGTCIKTFEPGAMHLSPRIPTRLS